jgi:hypothetical protein
MLIVRFHCTDAEMVEDYMAKEGIATMSRLSITKQPGYSYLRAAPRMHLTASVQLKSHSVEASAMRHSEFVHMSACVHDSILVGESFQRLIRLVNTELGRAHLVDSL